LSADTLRRRGLFDPKAVAALVADDQAGRVDAAYTILGLECIRDLVPKIHRQGLSQRSQRVGDLKIEVRNFWNEASCGERLLLDASDKLGYQEQMAKRYSLEPFIESFARFDDSPIRMCWKLVSAWARITSALRNRSQD
jgi:hypothetical protein